MSSLLLLLCWAELGRGSVIRVGDSYYYDVTNMLAGRRFQVTPFTSILSTSRTLLCMMVTVVFPPQLEFHGPGQGMTRDWWLGARSWGRASRGAVVRLGGLGEVRLVTSCAR